MVTRDGVDDPRVLRADVNNDLDEETVAGVTRGDRQLPAKPLGWASENRAEHDDHLQLETTALLLPSQFQLLLVKNVGVGEQHTE